MGRSPSRAVADYAHSPQDPLALVATADPFAGKASAEAPRAHSSARP
jgi:hypothetical protein